MSPHAQVGLENCDKMSPAFLGTAGSSSLLENESRMWDHTTVHRVFPRPQRQVLKLSRRLRDSVPCPGAHVYKTQWAPYVTFAESRHYDWRMRQMTEKPALVYFSCTQETPTSQCTQHHHILWFSLVSSVWILIDKVGSLRAREFCSLYKSRLPFKRIPTKTNRRGLSSLYRRFPFFVDKVPTWGLGMHYEFLKSSF